jgi:predicted ATPase
MLREAAAALEIIAAEIPLLLVLEDLQWADPSTVDLLSALARGRGAGKLMVLGTYRTADPALGETPLRGVVQSLLVHHLCHELALDPLDEREIAAYLTGEATASGDAKNLAALLYRQSEGNPLFMIALLEQLRQRGAAAHENGHWQLRVPAEEIELQVPENLRRIMEFEIDQPGGAGRRVVEAASAAGDVFATVVCAAAAAMDVGAFDDLRAGLSRRNRIVRMLEQKRFATRIASERPRITHTLYREALYRRQSPDRRAKLRQAICAALAGLTRGFEECGARRRIHRRAPVEIRQARRTWKEISHGLPISVR